MSHPGVYRLCSPPRGRSSFTEFLSLAAPELLPGRRPLPPGSAAELAPHGTTIVAIACTDGVVMAGDRRATMGNLIASRDIEKVYPADAYSLIGIAGTAGIGLELMRLFQVELEHYEKIEGTMLSLRRQGEPARLDDPRQPRRRHAGTGRGPAVRRVRPRTGPRTRPGRPDLQLRRDRRPATRRQDYDAIGSGSLFAKSALKKRYTRRRDGTDAIRLAVEALYDAADDDTATGGPDLTRKIYPIVMTATAEGTRRVTEDEAAAVAEAVVAGRRENPGG